MFERAWHIGRDFNGQQFSPTNRTSFALMQRLHLRQTATFETDFAICRFGRTNAEAFEMMR